MNGNAGVKPSRTFPGVKVEIEPLMRVLGIPGEEHGLSIAALTSEDLDVHRLEDSPGQTLQGVGAELLDSGWINRKQLELADQADGDWWMLSILHLTDKNVKAGTVDKHTDERKSLSADYYLAYCFKTEELYCVRPWDGEKAGNYVTPLKRLGYSGQNKFAELNQYRPILFKLAVYFNERIRPAFHQLFKGKMGFVDGQAQSFSLEKMWRKDTGSGHLLGEWKNYAAGEDLWRQFMFVKEMGVMSPIKVEVESGRLTADSGDSLNKEGEDCKERGQACKESLEAYPDFPRELYIRMSLKNLGANIKRLRERSNYSQDDIAKRTGKTQAQISRIESGNLEPGIIFLLQLCYLFNCSIAELTMEPAADWVGKLIWICKDVAYPIKTRPDAVPIFNYEQYRVLAVNPDRELYVVKNDAGLKAKTMFEDGKVKAETIVTGGLDITKVEVYSLRRAFFTQDTGVCDHQARGGYKDTFLILGDRHDFQRKFLESAGIVYREHYNIQIMPEGWKQFDLQGYLVEDSSEGTEVDTP